MSDSNKNDIVCMNSSSSSSNSEDELFEKIHKRYEKRKQDYGLKRNVKNQGYLNIKRFVILIQEWRLIQQRLLHPHTVVRKQN